LAGAERSEHSRSKVDHEILPLDSRHCSGRTFSTLFASALAFSTPAPFPSEVQPLQHVRSGRQSLVPTRPGSCICQKCVRKPCNSQMIRQFAQACANGGKIVQASRRGKVIEMHFVIGERIMSKVTKTLVVATIIAVPAAAALAQTPPSYPYGPDAPGGYYSEMGPGFPIAPYGYANPSYSGYYGTYPSYTYDPDPNLRAQLRSDFNRGVDSPAR
jgi:hypothetical protein